MSAHSVSPPVDGTRRAVNMDALAARVWNDESVCQPSLPARWRTNGSSAGSRFPSAVQFVNVIVSMASSPNRRPKPGCSASLRCWPGKTRTAYSRKAAAISAHSASVSAASSTSVTTAPSVAPVGSMCTARPAIS